MVVSEYGIWNTLKMVRHPNWSESKQAFSIIWRESPLQSVLLQTLQFSNDNLNCWIYALSFSIITPALQSVTYRLNHIEIWGQSSQTSFKRFTVKQNLPKVVKYIELFWVDINQYFLTNEHITRCQTTVY